MKPKDMAFRLEMKPVQVTRIAEKIEEMGIHQFNQTPLGSYLFEEAEVELLQHYLEVHAFFRQDEPVKEIMNLYLERNPLKIPKKLPPIFDHLHNIRWR